MIVLGVETSCDDTSLALYEPERGVIGQLTANQLIHERYGGVVPEIASRTHIRTVLPAFNALLELATGIDRSDIQGIGVSNGPGLVGSLVVGVGFAKALSLALERPVVGVHHIEAHILSNELEGKPLRTPALALIVSGGHTSLYRVKAVGRYELVGNTRDDAAGECFDKIAKLLGLGFPGGPAIEKAARRGDRSAIQFPRAMMVRGNYDFSFSGLKTAVRVHVEKSDPGPNDIGNIASSAQEAIVDVLVDKTVAYAKEHMLEHVYLAGGVAANERLRTRLSSSCDRGGLNYHAPPLKYCTDNGAMVACAAEKHLARGCNDSMTLDVFARGPIVSWS